MADPLSFVASILAVVGTADTVLRAGTELSHFLTDIKDAPAEVIQLRTCLQENTLLVETSKHYLQELTDSNTLSSTSREATDLSKAITLFTSSVKSIERELSSLVTIARRLNGNKSWGRIRWVLDGRRIGKAMHKLESVRLGLTAALVLVSRRESALAIKGSGRAVERNFQQLVSGLDAASTSINNSQQKMLVQQEKIITRTSKQLKQTTVLQKGLSTISRSSRSEHRKTREQIAQGHLRVIDTLSNKIDGIQTAIPKATVARRRQGRDIFFVGENQESVLTPLLLLRDTLRGVILGLVSQHTESVLSDHLFWLQAEYENLVSSVIQEVAALSKGSTATSFDNWCENGWTAYSSRTGSQTEDQWPNIRRKISEVAETRSNYVNEKSSQQQQSRAGVSYSSVVGPGELRLTLSLSNHHADSADDHDEVSFFFHPAATICTTALSARFVKVVARCHEPRFYTQLNAYSIVAEDQIPRYVFLLQRGAIKDIDLAIRNGTISPYHIHGDTGYHMIIFYAAAYARADLLRYLDSQGIGISNLNGECTALEGLLFAILGSAEYRFPTTRHIDAWQSVQDYFEETRSTFNPQIQGQRLLYPVSLTAKEVCPDDISVMPLVRRLMKLLREENLSFAQPTPLLVHSFRRGSRSLAMIQLLLEYGANAHATDMHGNNAIHLAILSNLCPEFGESRESPDLLEQKLTFLIEAGADVHQANRKGWTPSRLALGCGCWDEWCAALARNGLGIDENLKRERDLWNLSDDNTEDGDISEHDHAGDDDVSVPVPDSAL